MTHDLEGYTALAAARDTLEHAGSEVDASVVVDQTYRALRKVELHLPGSGPVALLLLEAIGLVDRIRAHRASLSRANLSLIRQATALLLASHPGGASGPGAAEVLALAAALNDVARDDTEDDEGNWELFVFEGRRQLESCVADVEALRGEATRDEPLVHRAFRSLHTFKGNCGLLGNVRLEAMARAMEDALAALRAGEAASTPGLRRALLDLLTTTLDALTVDTEHGERPRHALLQALDQARQIAHETRLGNILVANRLVDPMDIEAALAWKSRPLGEILVELRALSPDALEAALAEQRRLRGDPAAVTGPPPAQSSKFLHLSADRVAYLVNAALGLVDQLEEGWGRARVLAASPPLLQQVNDLRDAATRVELTPLSVAFRRAELAVRDLGGRSRKRLTLRLSGDAVEVDRASHEALSTVLLHAVRNAIDHGVEPEAERIRAGKDAVASLRIDWMKAQNGLLLSVEDDGRGLDRDLILRRGAELGMRPADASDAAALELIFRPGFSSAREVSDSSGRGVGMDAMRERVAALGGTIEISSILGVGMKLTVRLPQATVYVPAASDDSRATSGVWQTASKRRTAHE